MKPEFQWNAATVERLRALRADGHSAADIAREIGAPSRNAVLGKIHRLGMGERKVSSHAIATPSRIKKPKLSGAERIEAARLRNKESAAAKDALRRDREEAKRGDAEVEAMRAQQDRVGAWAWLPLPGTEPASLMKLKTRSCRWPVETERGTRYCGCMTPKAGLTYCPSHQAVSTRSTLRTPDQVRLVASLMSASGNVTDQP